MNTDGKSKFITDEWDFKELEKELYIDSSIEPKEEFYIETKESDEYFGLDPVESFGDWSDYLDAQNSELEYTIKSFLNNLYNENFENYIYGDEINGYHGGLDIGSESDHNSHIEDEEQDIYGDDENWILDQIESRWDDWIEEEKWIEDLTNMDYNDEDYLDEGNIAEIYKPEEDQVVEFIKDMVLCGVCDIYKPLNAFSTDKLKNVCDSCLKDLENDLNNHHFEHESQEILLDNYKKDFYRKLSIQNSVKLSKESIDYSNLVESENLLVSNNEDFKKVHNSDITEIESTNEIYNEVISYFPNGMTPRPEQKEILMKIAKGIEDGYHIFLLDAGTGIGKSAIATTLAEYFGTAFITTVTKQLQDQYKDDFNYPVLKGRTNFDCKESLIFNKVVSCEDGICQTENVVCENSISNKANENGSICFEDRSKMEWYFKGNKHCNYWEQKGEAVRSPITLMNYSSFFLEMNFLKHFKKRKLYVFDEAHNIERLVMKLISLTLSNKKLKSDFKDYMDAITADGEIKAIPQISEDAFIEDKDFWYEYLLKFIDNYKSLLKIGDIPNKKRNEFRRVANRLDMTRHELKMNPQNWIIEVDIKAEKVVFKPIEVSKYVKNYCFEHGDYSLLMSATILNKEHFCKWHGLDPEDVLYINVKSPFDVSRRPIHLETVGSMSHKIIKLTKPQTIPALKEILQKHELEKGLIHTNSHKLANYIFKEMNDPRIINYSSDESGSPRDKIIRKYIKSDRPLVLVAPSVDEGVDFPDDLCRFQIIYKIPFPYLGDKQVKARMKIDRNWYAYQTVVKLVQSYGRGMRNQNDYCDTYILDQDIYGVLLEEWRKCKQYIPEYFIEALIDPEGIIQF